jgi:threonyl-tRNA synthetase
MIHHAVLGSVERFLGMLLEHYRGELPFWLAPEQVAVASIGEAPADYAVRVTDALEAEGLRVALDIGPERLPRKIVEAREAAIPVLLAVGAREARDVTVSVRDRDGKQESLPLDAALARLKAAATV